MLKSEETKQKVIPGVDTATPKGPTIGVDISIVWCGKRLLCFWCMCLFWLFGGLPWELQREVLWHRPPRLHHHNLHNDTQARHRLLRGAQRIPRISVLWCECQWYVCIKITINNSLLIFPGYDLSDTYLWSPGHPDDVYPGSLYGRNSVPHPTKPNMLLNQS